MEVRKAYEYTLDMLGHSMGAGALWQEYIQCLQAPKVGTPAFAALYPNAVQGQEEQQRVTAIRCAAGVAYWRGTGVGGWVLWGGCAACLPCSICT